MTELGTRHTENKLPTYSHTCNYQSLWLPLKLEKSICPAVVWEGLTQVDDTFSPIQAPPGSLGQLADVAEQPPAVLSVVHRLDLQHCDLHTTLILRREGQRQHVIAGGTRWRQLSETPVIMIYNNSGSCWIIHQDLMLLVVTKQIKDSTRAWVLLQICTWLRTKGEWKLVGRGLHSGGKTLEQMMTCFSSGVAERGTCLLMESAYTKIPITEVENHQSVTQWSPSFIGSVSDGWASQGSSDTYFTAVDVTC